MLPPSCIHVLLSVSTYTLTRPDIAPMPSMPFSHGAPTATRVPSADSDTDHPDKSSAASPSMMPPSCIHVLLSVSTYTLTRPGLEARGLELKGLSNGVPTATRVPAADSDTDQPDQSPPASPLMSPPSCTHVPLSESTYPLTRPELEPLPSL